MSRLKQRLVKLNHHQSRTKNMKKYANLFKLKKLSSRVQLDVTDEWLLDEFGDEVKGETDEEKLEELRYFSVVYKNPSLNEVFDDFGEQMMTPLGTDTGFYTYLNGNESYIVSPYLNDLAVAQLGLDSFMEIYYDPYHTSMDAKGKTGEEVLSALHSNMAAVTRGDDVLEIYVTNTSDGQDGTYELENGKFVKVK